MILIAGRTCTGKDTLVRKLHENGLTVLQSYTTRPKRYEEENTHIFITPEDSAKITDKVATTVLNGYEYFATKSQLKNCDIYIIDPNGIKTLTSNCPDEKFQLIYVSADFSESMKKAVKRSKNPEERKIFESRYASENDQFTAFEKEIENSDTVYGNCKLIYHYKNNFTKNCLDKAVADIMRLIEKR